VLDIAQKQDLLDEDKCAYISLSTSRLRCHSIQERNDRDVLCFSTVAVEKHNTL